jgi:uncharacterized membrane protein YjdF
MATNARGRRRPHVSLLLSWGVLAVFTGIFLRRGNLEFLLYAATLTVLIALVQHGDRRFDYPAGVKWSFLAWLVMHMCGGHVHLGGTRLYDVILLPLAGAPYHILRYDQFVHLFCYLTIGGLLRAPVERLAAPGAPSVLLRLLVLLAALGVGALNEIVEFAAVVLFRAAGVGDYWNNALDNVFNALGALAASLVWPPRGGRSQSGGGAGSPFRQSSERCSSSPSR